MFYDAILNSIADPVFVKNDKFEFVYLNDALCDMLGLTKESIMGKTLGESLPKDEMEHFLEVDKTVLDSGISNVSEEPLTGKGGKTLTIVTKKTRFIDEKGNKFIVGIIRDITKLKKVELELQDKISELEKMNEMTMGRELKMIELKREIEELKKK
ncbi:MAG: PAS domain S-box protein [Candidatus Magasanikbacteria bacterium]